MKRIALGVGLAVVAGGGLWAARAREGTGPTGPTSANAIAPVTTRALETLGVDALMKDVDHHRGPMVVEGVVKAASPEWKTVELIDCEEFRSCGTTTCARLVLPVRWTGASPAVRETARATGEVREDGGKLVFVASSVEVVTKEPAK